MRFFIFGLIHQKIVSSSDLYWIFVSNINLILPKMLKFEAHSAYLQNMQKQYIT
jgi:hypothetical protein